MKIAFTYFVSLLPMMLSDDARARTTAPHLRARARGHEEKCLHLVNA